MFIAKGDILQLEKLMPGEVKFYLPITGQMIAGPQNYSFAIIYSIEYIKLEFKNLLNRMSHTF